MLEEYIKGESTWKMRDNTIVHYKEMTVAHIKNVMKMLSKSGKLEILALNLKEKFSGGRS